MWYETPMMEKKTIVLIESENDPSESEHECPLEKRGVVIGRWIGGADYGEGVSGGI
jgi:hypothetical protein